MNRLSLVPLSSDHFSLLFNWMQEPHISQWWGEGKKWSFKVIQEKYQTYALGYKIFEGIKKPISAFIIFSHGHPIGLIQVYNAFDFPRDGFKVNEIWKSSESLAAIDFYIGDPKYLGKGLGTEVLKTFLETHVFKKFDACLVDPEKANKIAIKTYANAGFSTIYEMRDAVVMVARKKAVVNPIIIFGSSRSNGHTLQAIETVIKDREVPIMDLNKLNISEYDYHYKNKDDDFLPLAEKMVQHNPIILATPVYWYTMSAIMKKFIDRWSDLLHLRKDIGRRLANEELYVITSYGESIPRGFEDAFSQTCEYMDMQYRECYYFYSGDDQSLINNNGLTAEKFSRQIFHQ